HLVLALLIYAAIVWALRRLGERPRLVTPARLKVTGYALVAMTFVQLYLGALVAGLRAGLVYNTWPEIDGALIPSGAQLWCEGPCGRTLFETAPTVQFDPRKTAYALLALAVFHAIDAVTSRLDAAARGALWLLAAVTLQGVLGILTLLN